MDSRTDQSAQRPTAPDGDERDSHSAFDLLAPGVQRQLYAMKWPTLRPIQVETIHAYLETDRDLVLMAETAAGKTEAAFLPVLSSISDEAVGSVRAVYVGPLKALINDQFARLEELCTHLEMPVYRWHGDVSAARKHALERTPGGVLLITPESLESLLVNRTAKLGALFGGLRVIVIDELHAFLEGERGLHLASLLARIDRYRDPAEPAARRVGLSATIGDHEIAQRYLSPARPERVTVIRDDAEGTEIRLRVSGYDAVELRKAATTPVPADENADTEKRPTDEELVTAAVAEDLVEHCRASSNLVFANAKGDIEILADLANEYCGRAGLPRSFLVHHGSLSKAFREDVETEMKDDRPRTAVCSSTLEMGIDIGAVRTVGQVGAPWSVASLKQRMGRSGRKAGEARRLRCYVDCTTRIDPTDPLDLLPLDLLQTIAAIELMLEGWVEPPSRDVLDLSTLTHQTISAIAETGAVGAQDLYRRLCEQGPFGSATQPLFLRLLRALGKADVIEQDPRGALILGLHGERLRARRDFYAAFASRAEYTVVSGNRALGTLPVSTLPKSGDHIVFAARRWRVTDIDEERRQLHVRPATRRERPKFVGSGGSVHHRIVDRMRTVLREEKPIRYLDPTARRSLDQARTNANRYELAARTIVPITKKRCLWLTWTGSAETRAYAAYLESKGMKTREELVGVVCESGTESVREAIDEAARAAPDLIELAEYAQPKRRRKYDDLLPDDLLSEGIATELLWRPPTLE